MKIRAWFKLLFHRHMWETHQVALNDRNDENMIFVLAWRQCSVCAKSELVHTLI